MTPHLFDSAHEVVTASDEISTPRRLCGAYQALRLGYRCVDLTELGERSADEYSEVPSNGETVVLLLEDLDPSSRCLEALSIETQAQIRHRQGAEQPTEDAWLIP